MGPIQKDPYALHSPASGGSPGGQLQFVYGRLVDSEESRFQMDM